MSFIKDEYGNEIDAGFTITDTLLSNLRYWCRYITKDPFLNKELKELGQAAHRVLAAKKFIEKNK